MLMTVHDAMDILNEYAQELQAMIKFCPIGELSTEKKLSGNSFDAYRLCVWVIHYNLLFD
jgi:hypothetical protein